MFRRNSKRRVPDRSNEWVSCVGLALLLSCIGRFGRRLQTVGWHFWTADSALASFCSVSDRQCSRLR
jgi:hypothetical protein